MATTATKVKTLVIFFSNRLSCENVDSYKSWLALGIEELGRDVAAEVESYWMVPLFAGVVAMTQRDLITYLLNTEADWPWHEQQQKRSPTASMPFRE